MLTSVKGGVQQTWGVCSPHDFEPPPPSFEPGRLIFLKTFMMCGHTPPISTGPGRTRPFKGYSLGHPLLVNDPPRNTGGGGHLWWGDIFRRRHTISGQKGVSWTPPEAKNVLRLLFWNDLFITPLYDQDQKLTHFIGVLNDVTEIQDAKRKLEEYAQVLEDKVEEVICELCVCACLTCMPYPCMYAVYVCLTSSSRAR